MLFNSLSAVPANLFRPELTVMDIVYNPRETKLLQEAKAGGCRTISGLEMFLNQAVLQFELDEAAGFRSTSCGMCWSRVLSSASALLREQAFPLTPFPAWNLQ